MLVVCPLNSIIEDQIRFLGKVGIQCGTLRVRDSTQKNMDVDTYKLFSNTDAAMMRYQVCIERWADESSMDEGSTNGPRCPTCREEGTTTAATPEMQTTIRWLPSKCFYHAMGCEEHIPYGHVVLRGTVHTDQPRVLNIVARWCL